MAVRFQWGLFRPGGKLALLLLSSLSSPPSPLLSSLFSPLFSYTLFLLMAAVRGRLAGRVVVVIANGTLFKRPHTQTHKHINQTGLAVRRCGTLQDRASITFRWWRTTRNEFTPIAVNEYGDAGAEAMGATMGSPFPLIS